MKTHAVAVLELVLEKAHRDRATEVRFISGMCPALVVGTSPRFVEIAELKFETVKSIHHECLSLADRSQLVPLAKTTYIFTSSKLGRYRCKYQLRGNTASLTLVPETDASELIDAIHPAKPPSLRAEANPDDPDFPNERAH